MTRTSFRTLSEPIMADPLRRARVEEMGRAMDVVIALAKLVDAHCETSHDTPVAGDVSAARAPRSTDEDSEFLAAVKEGIERLGGRLEVTAVFPDRRVQLLG